MMIFVASFVAGLLVRNFKVYELALEYKLCHLKWATKITIADMEVKILGGF